MVHKRLKTFLKVVVMSQAINFISPSSHHIPFDLSPSTTPTLRREEKHGSKHLVLPFGIEHFPLL